MPIIDVHTHMFTRRWLELLRVHGDPDWPHRVHNMGSLANTAALPPDQREAIRGENAQKLFGL